MRIQVARKDSNGPSPSDSRREEATTIQEGKNNTIENTVLTAQTQNSNENRSSSIVQQEATSIEIDSQDNIYSVAFLVDGNLIVSADVEGKIRRWRVQDGNEVGAPMDVGSCVLSMAVSRDGKWVISGTNTGQVTVWNNAESHEEVTEFKGHSDWVCAVDVSPNGSKIATGSGLTAHVWSLSTGHRLLGPFTHDFSLGAVKFSPDGRLFATATCHYKSVRIYDSHDGHLVDFPIQVNWLYNGSLAWTSDNKQLFALSGNGNINCLDVSTGITLSKWPIHSNNDPRCIALASNGIFLAAFDKSSISFWDTTTHKQIGSIISHTRTISSVAISANYDVAVGGERKITLWNLLDILPSHYFDSASVSKGSLHETPSSSQATLLAATEFP